MKKEKQNQSRSLRTSIRDLRERDYSGVLLRSAKTVCANHKLIPYDFSRFRSAPHSLSIIN